METDEAMVLMPPDAPLAVTRAPEAVLEEARKAAAALKHVIDAKPKKVKFNGETYLEYEDWLTVARFYGVTARIREVKHVQFGEAQGFEAFAEAVLVGTGQIVSAADAMCLNDEKNWNTRPVYEWQNGTRKKIGDEAVPLFQLRSMAQTRACAKALRNVLAWVVVLAGYKATPAEEMDGMAHDAPPKKAQAAPAAPAPKGPAPQPSPNQAQAGDYLDINISEVRDDIVASGKNKGNAYLWVADGPLKSWPCFDAGTIKQLKGLVGENVRVKLAQGNKGKYIVGIVSDADDSLGITDADLPVEVF